MKLFLDAVLVELLRQVLLKHTQEVAPKNGLDLAFGVTSR